eukprot:TRINITY_DN24635_c0_g1_i1.p1 TRINITY_DN24635_c0_g1~~TRINITY_DN24635_c0_g1_i1.p1  ORF type:complete len:104 (+),score=6.86 TRINITY_DN24635_c0_g1_i1:551-862(+)
MIPFFMDSEIHLITTFSFALFISFCAFPIVHMQDIELRVIQFQFGTNTEIKGGIGNKLRKAHGSMMCSRENQNNFPLYFKIPSSTKCTVIPLGSLKTQLHFTL